MTNAFFTHDAVTYASLPNSLSFGEGHFVFDVPLPSRRQALSSSGKKLVYKGTFHMAKDGSRYNDGKLDTVSHPAYAVFFLDDESQDYAREHEGLVRANERGCGPRLFVHDAVKAVPPCESRSRNAESRYVLVEEDAGLSLDRALEGEHVPLACACDGPSAGIDLTESADYGRYAAKVIFDVLSQVSNLQRDGLFHRDLKASNIALKCKSSEPAGLKATLIDFESLTEKSRASVREDSYHDLLFRSRYGDGMPRWIEQDAGYLTVVLAEIKSRRTLRRERRSGESLEDLLGDPGSRLGCALKETIDRDGLFWYEDGEIKSRRIAQRDLDRYARMAGLRTVREAYGRISKEAVDIAEGIAMHGGYIDEFDVERIEGDARMVLEERIVEVLARKIFETYKDELRYQGKPIPYEEYESQPADYIASNVAQARHIGYKVDCLGYELKPLEALDESKHVTSFTERQVEILAEIEHERWMEERAEAGWTYAPEKDEEKKTSPCMVPYAELEDDIREYDRAFIRNLINLVESAGLCVSE